MSEIKLYNESYTDTVYRLQESGITVDLVITSPPYNTNKKQGKKHTLLNADNDSGYSWVRYDTVQDDMTNAEYARFIASFFVDMNCILSANGVVLLNLSYGNENPDGIWLAVSEIIEGTEFTVADCIVWKKPNALPNNVSSNRLTRLCEFVFVCVRKEELKTFHANKKPKSKRGTGQTMFGSIPNIIYARNNDGVCPYNKAAFSSELVGALLDIYAPPNAVVYDPFSGSGTTAAECKRRGLTCYGSEISEKQYNWALNRVNAVQYGFQPRLLEV